MDKASRDFILKTLDTAGDLTIATNRPDGYPQATTTSFVHDGLTLYIAVGKESQKAQNIAHDGRVSVVVDTPYRSWMEIKGLSMAADASIVANDAEKQKIGALMAQRFGAEMKDFPQEEVAAAMGNAAFLRVRPKLISLLDYTKGFGHTEEVKVMSADFE